MRALLCLLPWLLLPGAIPAQNVREPVALGGVNTEPQRLAVASDGELSAVVCQQDSNQSLWVSASDGRGVGWSTHVRLDDGSSTRPKELARDGVAVVRDTVYVCWRDRRVEPDGAWNACFNVSRDRGQSFLPQDLLVDKGRPLYGNEVTQLRMAVDPGDPADPGDDLVALLLAVHETATGREELRLNYSLDGGRTFLPSALLFSLNPATVEIEEMALAVQDGVVYGAWLSGVDSFTVRGIWLSRFNARLGSFDVLDELLNRDTYGQLDPVGGLGLAVRGDTVAAAWCQRPWLKTADELRFVASADGGRSWLPSRRLGDYAPGLDDVDSSSIGLTDEAGSCVVALWTDDRSGTDQVWSSVSSDRGTTWSGDKCLSIAGAGAPLLTVANGTVVASWLQTGAAEVETALSIDGGLSWGSAFPLSRSVRATADPVTAWNPRYSNFIAAWIGDDSLPGPPDSRPYVGGFRPQTLSPSGSFAVPYAPVWFEVRRWPRVDHGRTFFVVASRAPGDQRLPDGRNLGLRNDAFLSATWPASPVLSGTILPDGNGATPVFPSPAIGGSYWVVGLAADDPGDPATIRAFTDPVMLP